MKNSNIHTIAVFLGLIILSSCTREDEIVGWLPGTWRIEKYERTRINNDATVTPYLLKIMLATGIYTMIRRMIMIK